MPKKQRIARVKPDDYIHYGKPEEVNDTRVSAELIGGEWVLVRRQVKSAGVSTATPKVAQRRTINVKDMHSDCTTAKGVSMLFTRQGETLCRDCYTFRWNISPYFDDLLE